VIPAPDGYLADARRITADRGALLAIDEVQTGIGRTGSWLAHQRAGVTPDVITLAKGLGGGMPIGATIGIGEAGTLLQPGQHGSTFAGNPVCAAAALAVLDTIERDGLLGHVAGLGKHIRSGIENLGHPLIGSLRGDGLLIGIVLTDDLAPAAALAARDAGYIVNAPAADVIRLAPPLILTTEQADGFVADLPSILDVAADAAGSAGTGPAR
jgi:acetylornithine/N-succinyldiaminopimelate aminotransferase